MHQEQLFPLVRQQYEELMAGYVVTPELENLNRYIVPCSLGDNQGVMGCLELALEAVGERLLAKGIQTGKLFDL